MTDHYQSFTASPLGKFLVNNLGLPNPTPLERWSECAIAWYLSPGSTAVNGNVVRVCGQMMLGA